MKAAPRNASRIALLLGVALGALLWSSGAAVASEGLLGPVEDFDVTMFNFGVIAFFLIVPIVLSIIQHRLETRRERAREQLERIRRS